MMISPLRALYLELIMVIFRLPLRLASLLWVLPRMVASLLTLFSSLLLLLVRWWTVFGFVVFDFFG